MASNLSLWVALVLVTSSVILAGCGNDETEQDVDVTQACNRLEDLAGVVRSVRSAKSAQEVQTALDERLAELAHTYDSRFSAYLKGDGINARQAGNEADIALDRAGARCTEFGAANVFPQES